MSAESRLSVSPRQIFRPGAHERRHGTGPVDVDVVPRSREHGDARRRVVVADQGDLVLPADHVILPPGDHEAGAVELPSLGLGLALQGVSAAEAIHRNLVGGTDPREHGSGEQIP